MEPRKNSRLANIFEKAEYFYLALIRYTILIFATVMLAYALWLALSGLHAISRDPASIQEAPTHVRAEALTDLNDGTQAPSSARVNTSPSDNRKTEKAYYQDFRKRYFNLYRQKFEAYRHGSDARLSEKEFDSAFLSIDRRLSAVAEGTLSFEQDRDDLEALFSAMKEAATLPVTTKRLAAYRRTQPRRVVTPVQKSRLETYCAYYDYYLDSCIVHDQRSVSYTEQQIRMAMPDGIRSPLQLFTAYQENFGRDLTKQRAINQAKAAEKRQAIAAGNLRGQGKLWTAVQICGAFLTLMAFFLLIAIERHQRRSAAALAHLRTKETEEPDPSETDSPAAGTATA